MDYIVVYSTHCPQCKVLEKKLQLAGINFDVIDDVNEMNKLGLKSAPAMQVNAGPIMNFKEAIAWVKERTNG